MKKTLTLKWFGVKSETKVTPRNVPYNAELARERERQREFSRQERALQNCQSLQLRWNKK